MSLATLRGLDTLPCRFLRVATPNPHPCPGAQPTSARQLCCSTLGTLVHLVYAQSEPRQGQQVTAIPNTSNSWTLPGDNSPEPITAQPQSTTPNTILLRQGQGQDQDQGRDREQAAEGCPESQDPTRPLHPRQHRTALNAWPHSPDPQSPTLPLWTKKALTHTPHPIPVYSTI